MKLLVLILSIACLALGSQLFLRERSGGSDDKQLSVATTRAQGLSNEVVEARAKIEDESRLAAYLQSNLTLRVNEISTLTNSLGQTAASLDAAQQEVKTARAEAQKHAARVTELEGQRDEMQTKLDELAGSIKSLNVQITEAKRKLAVAEGDRDSVTKELARLQSDKAELLRQFNDLAALRAQVALLRDEAAINQRVAWMSQGVYQAAARKGAEALIAKPAAPAAAGNPSINVEIKQGGGTTSTNPSNQVPAQK